MGSADQAGIAGIYPLNRLSQAGLGQLSGGMRTIELPAGQVLFRIGETSPSHYFLLAGKVDLVDGSGRLFMSMQVVPGGAAVPLPQGIPSGHEARVAEPSRLLAIERQLLNTVLLLDQPDSAHAIELSYAGAGAGAAWREAFLRARGYARIGRDRLDQLFRLMEPVTLPAGAVFIREGEMADYFYVVAEGFCEVTRCLQDLPEPMRVAQYGPGASLGEDALLSDNPRNASVRMLTDGRLMRLSAEAFRSLLKPALALPVSYAEAGDMLARGARWLDVRLPREVSGRRLSGGIYIPHPVVRARLFTADPACSYIVVCEGGRDSPVIAYMMSKYGYAARYLDGGFAAIPPEALY
ncbi:MAG TPA: cyclic nucleotide-binding domain-containing protein [Solimonas sp.]|nr:cyclic nucleotide-binding domain-containing protein [Solimonas sp.]